MGAGVPVDAVDCQQGGHVFGATIAAHHQGERGGEKEGGGSPLPSHDGSAFVHGAAGSGVHVG